MVVGLLILFNQIRGGGFSLTLGRASEEEFYFVNNFVALSRSIACVVDVSISQEQVPVRFCDELLACGGLTGCCLVGMDIVAAA